MKFTTIIALSLAGATVANPLPQANNQDPDNISTHCQLYKLFNDTDGKPLPAFDTVSWSVDVFVHQKTTVETGSPGQGLKDNLKACHASDITTYSAVYRADNSLSSYQESFIIPPSSQAQCVQNAIKAAEAQSVTCEVGQHVVPMVNGGFDPNALFT